MKKHVFISCVLSVLIFPLVTAAADLSSPHRIFEIGIDADFGVANNYWGVGDVLQKELLIDLKEIANNMPSKGFNLAFHDREQVFLNLNLSSHLQFGVSAGVEANGSLTISNDLFDMLGSGMTLGSKKTIDVTSYADMFADINLSFKTIVNDFSVTVAPTYFVPLMFVPKTTVSGSVYTTQGGKIRANAESIVDVYTAVDMSSLVEDSEIPEYDIAEIMSNGGFDLTLVAERYWLDGLSAGMFTRIPIIPGRLKHKMTTRVYAYFEEDNLMDFISDRDKELKKDAGHDDFTYSDADYRAYRPFKLGVNATYAPFGEWLKLMPMLAVAVRNPYSSDMIVYPEYSVDVQLALWRLLFLNAGTAYTDQIFQQRVGFALNLRLVELLAQVRWCGTDFKNSFNLTGSGAFVGVRIGF